MVSILTKKYRKDSKHLILQCIIFLRLEEHYHLECCSPQSLLTLPTPPMDLLNPISRSANPTAAPIKWRNADVASLCLPLAIWGNKKWKIVRIWKMVSQYSHNSILLWSWQRLRFRAHVLEDNPCGNLICYKFANSNWQEETEINVFENSHTRLLHFHLNSDRGSMIIVTIILRIPNCKSEASKSCIGFSIMKLLIFLGKSYYFYINFQKHHAVHDNFSKLYKKW